MRPAAAGVRLAVGQGLTTDSRETAWAFRNAIWWMVIHEIDPREYSEAIHPHSPRAAHVKFMMEERDERIQATYYVDNCGRLSRVETQYDPKNFVRVNQKSSRHDGDPGVSQLKGSF